MASQGGTPLPGVEAEHHRMDNSVDWWLGHDLVGLARLLAGISQEPGGLAFLWGGLFGGRNPGGSGGDIGALVPQCCWSFRS
jgi:hypothetical protein